MNVMIAVTNMTAKNGGVTTHIIDLSKELVTRGVKVILVADECDDIYEKQVSTLENEPFFKYYSLDMKGIQSSIKIFFM